MNEEWIVEEISVWESILKKRVYRSERNLMNHLQSFLEGKNGVVIVLKFEKHFPTVKDLREFVALLDQIENKCEGIESLKIIRLLYKDWIVEFVLFAKSVTASIAGSAIWDIIKGSPIVEELEETEEYYLNGTLKRRTKRYKRKQRRR